MHIKGSVHISSACKKVFAFVGLFSFFINMLMLAVPLYMLQVFDRVILSKSVDTLVFLTIITFLSLVLYGALEIVRNRILVATGKWLDSVFTQKVFYLCPDAILNGNRNATAIMQDVQTLKQFLTGPSIFTIFDAPWIFVYLLVIWLIHPVLFFISLAGALILIMLAWLNQTLSSKPLSKATMQSKQNLIHFNTIMQNPEAIQGMGMLNHIAKRWQHDQAQMLENQKEASERIGSVSAVAKFCRMVLQIGVLGTGAYLVISHEMTPGGMIACSIILARALQPIEQAITTWRQIVMAQESYQKLNTFIKENQPRSQSLQLPEPHGDIEFENVSYTPPNSQREALKDINIKIPAGSILTIIGASASGKSTLAKLIVGAIAPQEGSVRIDGANAYTWQRDDFGMHMGFCPQEIELFPGSVAKNISRFGDKDEQKIVTAAQHAGAHEMILKLPNGYETEIAPLMKNLSGGQRQRIALARAFYNNPKILVLDEPDANLDQAGEHALMKAIINAKKRGTTVVLVSHHQSALQYADNILILQEGAVKMHDTKDVVMEVLHKSVKQLRAKGNYDEQ